MSRKKKLVLTGILAIIYIVIALNFHKIKFAISMFNLYSIETKTETESTTSEQENKAKSPVENPLEIIIQIDKPVDKQDEVVDSTDKSLESPDNGDDHIDHVTDNQPSKKPKPTNTKDDSKPSYISIVNDYNNKLEALRSDFEKELGDLMARAMADYSKGELSTIQLASKYLSSGTKLEKSSDSRFNEVVKDMEKELKTNGYDTAVIKDVKAYYTSFKETKKSDLISRGMKRVN